MKKTLIAATLASLLSGAALAGNVSVYGNIDLSLHYVKDADGVKQTQMTGGFLEDNFIGFTGEEDLGNGMKVSFMLEQGYESDTGAMANSDKLFNRGASITLSGNFGEVSVGTMGTLTSGRGNYDIFQAAGNPLGGGKGEYIGAIWVDRGSDDGQTYNNMVTYATPEVAGFKGFAQYSLGTVDDTKTGALADRSKYAALAGQFTSGNFQAVVAYDTIMKKDDSKDTKAVHIGANYDFGAFKLVSGIQISDNETAYQDVENADVIAFQLGGVIPMGNGELTLSSVYGDADAAAGDEDDKKVYGAGAFYTYSLSERTTIGGGVGYQRVKNEADHTNAYELAVGLSHAF